MNYNQLSARAHFKTDVDRQRLRFRIMIEKRLHDTARELG